MKEGVKKMLTIKDFYKISSEAETPFPLLTDFDTSEQDIDWWSEYVDNFQVLDYQFMKQFKSFVYFDQDEDATDEDNLHDFQLTVYSWLGMNNKRYSELYRIHVIPDDDSYNLAYNYDRHETYSGNNTSAGSAISGQRTDITYDNIGSQNSSDLNKVTGWNSGSENTKDSGTQSVGSREDTHQFTKGQEQDTSRTQGTDAHTSHTFGNIGVTTVDDMLKKHHDFWQLFNFYQIVFNDICKNYLLIGR